MNSPAIVQLVVFLSVKTQKRMIQFSMDFPSGFFFFSVYRNWGYCIIICPIPSRAQFPKALFGHLEPRKHISCQQKVVSTNTALI